jgi:proteic killer suppression protein
LAIDRRRAGGPYGPPPTQTADARQRCRSSRSAIAPGNRLEKLARDRKGQYSVRINDQWRICFRWAEGGGWDVEIVDYH